MVIRTGMIGLSEGNGHPFSFSAIINGYDRTAFKESGWLVILDYLDQQPAEMFGIGDAKITHAWTQDPDVTKKLCTASKIETAVAKPLDMLGQIDALIVARDDWACHAELALPFLEKGIPVFIDKPLTLDKAELEQFRPYLEQGILMSTSGFRYAVELEDIRQKMPDIQKISMVSATVLNGIEKYGIHMLDAVAGLGLSKPISISRVEATHQSFNIKLEDGTLMRLDCLGAVGKTFHLSIFGKGGHVHVDIHNNFMAFRRTLEHFYKMIEDRIPPIHPDQIIQTMHLIRQAKHMEQTQMEGLANA